MAAQRNAHTFALHYPYKCCITLPIIHALAEQLVMLHSNIGVVLWLLQRTKGSCWISTKGLMHMGLQVGAGLGTPYDLVGCMNPLKSSWGSKHIFAWCLSLVPSAHIHRPACCWPLCADYVSWCQRPPCCWLTAAGQGSQGWAAGGEV